MNHAAGVMGPLDLPERSSPRSSSFAWFSRFMREELALYPGRGLLISRTVVACTVMMLLVMVFRMPSGALGVYYCFNMSRTTEELPSATVLQTIAGFLAGAAYTIVSSMLFVNYPLTHFVYVVGSLFLSFFALKAVSYRTAAKGFSVLVIMSIPGWDSGAPTSLLVASNLWTFGIVTAGVACAWVTDYIFHLFSPAWPGRAALDKNLSLIEKILECAPSQPVDPWMMEELQQLAMQSGSATPPSNEIRIFFPDLKASVGAVAAALALTNLDDIADAERLDWKRRVAALRTRLHSNQSRDAQRERLVDPSRLMNQAMNIAEAAFDKASLPDSYRITLPKQPQTHSLFEKGAFTNRQYLLYGLKGCLAASLAYIFWNALDWPGLNTALFTCYVTALGSQGEERQKQTLRVVGACVGGFVLGVAAQALVLPRMEDIGGFTLYFVVCVALSTWFATSSNRLCYFGVQMGLAFFLVHLNETYVQTNLAIGRDRVVGILLGLVCMWLAFDTFGVRSIVDVFRETLAKSLRLTAQLASEVAASDPPDNLMKTLDEVAKASSQLIVQAGAVPFEMSNRRQQNLLFRDEMLRWVPALRQTTIVLNEINRAGGLVQKDAICELNREFQAAAAELQPHAGMPQRAPKSQVEAEIHTRASRIACVVTGALRQLESHRTANESP